MDFRIEWDPKGLEKATRQVMRETARRARGAVSNLTCPEHKQAPRIVEKRNSRTGDFEIEACCQPTMDKATNAVERALR